MNKTIRFLVKKTDEDKRIDIFLSRKIKEVTRSILKEAN